MEKILKDLCSVVGVTGAVVCGEDGQPLAVSCSETIDRSALPGMGKTLMQTLSGLELSRRRKIGELDLVFDNERVIVKSLGPGLLMLLCSRQGNVPLIHLSANAAARKLKEQLKLAEAPAGELRAAAAPAVPAVSGPKIPPESLSRVEHELALAVGPVAMLVVDETLAKMRSTRDTLAEAQAPAFLDAVAEVIPDAAKKERFLASAKIIFAR